MFSLSWLEAIVFDQHLNRDAAEFSAAHFRRQLKAVANVGAKIPAGPTQGGDQSDLDRFLRAGRGCRRDGEHNSAQQRSNSHAFSF